MTVEEIGKGKLGDENENFPAGLRVLAVDDDMTCLKILETLLKRCQFEVTTCNEAKVALEMLRKNRNRFDIIITDDHMPDMDGFKFLELVSLEMDLPVIMLSANSDLNMVKKGIAHGACDYLVKPVQIEKLKNIWQHVIRKKTREPKLENNSEFQDRDKKRNIESGIIVNSARRDEEEESQKPRFVWSLDLHMKFVAAVNQLGINGKGAVPKNILEHMNVEGLTRENVASHLQKYRLCLRRISLVTPLSSVVSSAEGKDSYMWMNSCNVFSNTTMQENTIRSVFKSNDLYRDVRVLIVDSDLNELILLDDQLRKWQCHVTIATKAKEALEILRDNKNSFDFLITEVHTPDMDGFKFLELVGIEMNLPIIMLLENTDGDIITNGNTYGACYYLVKPIRDEDLRMMWQNVMRSKAQLLKRKPRLVWTTDLHSKFIAAVNEIGIEKVSPKKILDLMGVEGLTKENVAAHLKKYRVKQLLAAKSQQANMFPLSQNLGIETREKETGVFGPNIVDLGTQKKSRIIWTVDIHRKFVTAINQLGDKNVVPERILELMNVEWLTREDVASHLEKYKLLLHRIGAKANTLNSVSTLEKVGCVVAQEREKASLFKPETTNNISNNLVVSNAITIPISQTSCQDKEWVVKMSDLSLIDEENTSKCSNLQCNGVEKSAIESKIGSNDDYLLEKMESQNDYESLDDFTKSKTKQDAIAKLAFLADSYFGHGAKDKIFAKYDFMEKMIEDIGNNRLYFLLGVTITIFVFMILKMF